MAPAGVPAGAIFVRAGRLYTSMITLCPHCGHRLLAPIHNGITACHNCGRVFDSAPYHRLLSLSWVVRKQDITEPDYLVSHFGADSADAAMLVAEVAEGGLSHEEFVRFLKARPDLKESHLDWAS